ncbi:hypothetical protein JTB14_032965 [Gonioctena quinquepunctata]|nr:hypothetical protein JTB14_032965 [Gonioctena quinquepunctata]
MRKHRHKRDDFQPKNVSVSSSTTRTISSEGNGTAADIFKIQTLVDVKSNGCGGCPVNECRDQLGNCREIVAK